MNVVDVFPTRFIIMGEIFDEKELIEILNVVKRDTEKLTDIMIGNHGPTYRTNYFVRNVSWPYFTPLLEKINKHLNKDGLGFELLGSPWYSEYGEYDAHWPHIHEPGLQRQADLMNVNDTLKYSGIINLSNFGRVMFINSNPSSFFRAEMPIDSVFGEVILFPSNVWHYVPPHGLRDKTRASFAFNGLLKGF